jgi:hypothetical protein
MFTSTRTASIATVVFAAFAFSASAAADDWARQRIGAHRFGPLDPAIQAAVSARQQALDPAIATAIAGKEASDLASSNASLPDPVVFGPSSSGGFDWADAGVGAGAAGLAALLVALVSLLAVRRTHSGVRHI